MRGTHRLQIDGEKVYRRTGGESKWLVDERTGEYELRVGDETIATFNTAEEIGENADAYPRRESEIEDQEADQWTTIRAPFVPCLEFEDVEMGEAPDSDIWDVIRVPSSNSNDEPAVVQEDGQATPLSELCEREDDRDRDRRDRSSGPLPEF